MIIWTTRLTMSLHWYIHLTVNSNHHNLALSFYYDTTMNSFSRLASAPGTCADKVEYLYNLNASSNVVYLSSLLDEPRVTPSTLATPNSTKVEGKITFQANKPRYFFLGILRTIVEHITIFGIISESIYCDSLWTTVWETCGNTDFANSYNYTVVSNCEVPCYSGMCQGMMIFWFVIDQERFA